MLARHRELQYRVEQQVQSRSVSGSVWYRSENRSTRSLERGKRGHNEESTTSAVEEGRLPSPPSPVASFLFPHPHHGSGWRTPTHNRYPTPWLISGLPVRALNHSSYFIRGLLEPWQRKTRTRTLRRLLRDARRVPPRWVYGCGSGGLEPCSPAQKTSVCRAALLCQYIASPLVPVTASLRPRPSRCGLT